MRSLDVLDTALDVLALGRPYREVSIAQPFDYDCAVDVELLTGLVLEGHIECRIEIQDGQFWISRQKLRLKDKDGREIPVDWDELETRPQTKIDDQIVRACAAERLAA